MLKGKVAVRTLLIVMAVVTATRATSASAASGNTSLIRRRKRFDSIARV